MNGLIHFRSLSLNPVIVENFCNRDFSTQPSPDILKGMESPNHRAARTQDVQRLSQADVDAICDAHERLLDGAQDGRRAMFADCDLSGTSLAGRALEGARLTGADLTGCDLSRADLLECDLSGCELSGTDLSFAILSRANLQGANLAGANLTGADCTDTDFRQLVRLKGPPDERTRPTLLTGANLLGACLLRARLAGIHADTADFTETNLKLARFNRAALASARFVDAILCETDFSGADLTGADFRGTADARGEFASAQTLDWITGPSPGMPEEDPADAVSDPGDARSLQEKIDHHIRLCRGDGAGAQPASFDGADFSQVQSLEGETLTALRAPGANLSGLNLAHTQLQGAKLAGADLRGADLRGADLRGADLRHCRLSHADLRDARLDGLRISADRTLPVRLDKAICRFTDFRSARLAGLVMAGADLGHARFGAAEQDQLDNTLTGFDTINWG